MPQPKACWAEGGISGGSGAGAPTKSVHLTSAQDFQNISSKLIQMLHAVAVPEGTSGCNEAGASPAWGTPHVAVLLFSPSACC